MAAAKTPDPATKAGYRRLAGVPRPEPDRVRAILRLLDAHYAEPTTALNFESPFQLLIATILSAQCTDETVNKVTPALFERYPDAPSLARADLATVEQLVRPTGFYRNKARNIVAAAHKVAHDFGGELPKDIDAFVTIPGAARKTANVVLGTAFGIPSGMVVDTHVARVSGRLGFHSVKDPVKIERALSAVVPRERWIRFGHQLIWHGRRICVARTPRCADCPLLPHCPEGKRRLPV